jgi:aerobic carbon-monoxide dehydrogenase medium subunit
MVALGATMTSADSDGAREVPADEFFLGVYMTAVGPGELLTKVTIPPGRRDGFASVTIGRDGTCVVSAAVSLDGGARVAIGCVDAVPHRASAVEAKLTGEAANGGMSLEAARAASAGLGATLDPPDDIHATGEYRRHVAEVVVARAIVQAGSRGGR